MSTTNSFNSLISLLILAIGFFALESYFSLGENERSSEHKRSRVHESTITYDNQQPRRTQAQVIRVIDGDTIELQFQDAIEVVRVIGIDTPETVKPNALIECFGPEATSRAHELLDNALVSISADPTQYDSDRYDRLLRHVYLSDGRSYGAVMIRGGFAKEYTFNDPYLHHDLYRAREREARSEKRGLWGECAIEKMVKYTVKVAKQYTNSK